MAKREQTFEQELEQLEQLVNALEAGKLPLNESFEAYEKGMKLLKSLESQLDASEAKIQLLTKDGAIDLPTEES